MKGSVGLLRWPLLPSCHLHPMRSHPALASSQYPASPFPSPHQSYRAAGREANGVPANLLTDRPWLSGGPLRWSRPRQRPRSQISLRFSVSLGPKAYRLQRCQHIHGPSTELWSPHRAPDPSTEAPASFRSPCPPLPTRNPDLRGRRPTSPTLWWKICLHRCLPNRVGHPDGHPSAGGRGGHSQAETRSMGWDLPIKRWQGKKSCLRHGQTQNILGTPTVQGCVKTSSRRDWSGRQSGCAEESSEKYGAMKLATPKVCGVQDKSTEAHKMRCHFVK